MPKLSNTRATLALPALFLSASVCAQAIATKPGAAEAAAQNGAAQTASQSAAQATGQEPTRPTAERPPREDPALLEAQSRQAYEDGEYLKFYIANMKLHNMFPYVPQYMINIVRACALLEKGATAYHFMHKMQQQGLSYDFNEFEDTRSVRLTQAYDYINNLMIEAGTPAGDGTVAMTLPGNPFDFVAMAWDGSRERLLVGTFSEGKVLAVGTDGQTEVLLQADSDNGLWAVTGLAVDEGRNRLWISSAATPAFAGYTETLGNRNALFEFDLETLERVARHDVPADGFYHELGGVALSDDGHAYVVDTVTPVIYRKLPERPGLEPFVASTELVAFTDVAVTPDNGRLFAADPVMGVFMVDPEAQTAAMLRGPETLNLGGIQSVEYRDRKLFIIQAGIQPERLVRLELDPSGSAVAEVVPMAVALEPFDRPGRGALVDDKFYYFANQGAGEGSPGAVVMRTNLNAGNAVKSLDIQDLQEALKPRDP